MFSIAPISQSLANFQLSFTAVSIAHIGPKSAKFDAQLLDALKVPWRDLVDNPVDLALLSWHTRISDFAGREQEIAELDEWANSRPAVSVKFVTGEGGVGKSRLAAQFADKLGKSKWAAGFVNLSKPHSFPMAKKGTLIIVDYPEENREGAIELLSDLANLVAEHPVRVLFLSRQDRSRWDDEVDSANAVDIVDAQQLALQPTDECAAYQVYFTALDEASKRYGTKPNPVSEEALAEWLRQAPENSRALFVVAAALHSAINPTDSVVRYTGRQVVEQLAEREIARLQRIARGANVPDPHAYSRLLAMAAIADKLTIERIEELAKNDLLRLGLPKDKDLEIDLQQAGILTDGAVQAPKPDIVAAALTVQALAKRERTAPELVWAALEGDIEGGLNRFARLAYDAEAVLGLQEERLSRWLPRAVERRPDRCRLIHFHIADTRLPMGLTDAAITACRVLLQLAQDEAEKANLLVFLSAHLAISGQANSALAAIQEAVDKLRHLAKADPTRFEPDLALSLNNLCGCLRNAGDNTGALRAIEEAVHIHRRFFRNDATRFEAHLATSLNNLSMSLSDTGDTKGALAAIREAVDIDRRLAMHDPVHFAADLASSLNNLSLRLSEIGDTKGAIEAIQEAVALYSRLAKARPDRFDPHLAVTLNNLSDRRRETGHTEGALQASKHVVELYERLAKANPVRFEPYLAKSYTILSERHVEAEDTQGALEAIQKAVDIHSRLAKDNPARFEPDLARGLNYLSIILSPTGDIDSVFASIREAIDIRRRLAEASPTRFEPDLAVSLLSLGTFLRASGHHEEAADAYREGADLMRPYAERYPEGSPARLLAALERNLHETLEGK